jgi:aminoglycoside 3-N-acetyltransferase I
MISNAEKIEVKQLIEKDLPVFGSLIEMFKTVFEESESGISNETNLQRLLSSSNFIVIAAVFENEVIGGLTAYVLPMYYSDDSEVFLYDMAVKPEYQRMGVGKRLLHHLKEYCIKSGIKEFFVLAHEEDEHAVKFYHATGGRSEKVINFIYEVRKIDE